MNVRIGERWRAAYASDPWASRGRLVPEEASPTRTEFQRDRDRIVHSSAFRRLKHKTQVFVYHEGDHYRTRLTHTIEVAQIARALARALGLDEDLAETLALVHDIGHPPFGHAGEDVLAERFKEFGGFDHNAQALRIVTRLEHRYAAFDGLNLTWETLEGLVKHNGPLVDQEGRPMSVYAVSGVPRAIVEYDQTMPLNLATQAGPEAQSAAISDDIAYNSHDLDDGLRAGLFSIGDLRSVPFLEEIIDQIAAIYPDLDDSRVTHEVSRRVITRFVEDAVAEGDRRLRSLNPKSAADIRLAQEGMIRLSEDFIIYDKEIKSFLHAHMYRHSQVMRVREQAAAILHDLITRYLREPSEMPLEWQSGSDTGFPRRVADYIAGMTDRYAILEHQRLFKTTPPLR